MKHNSAFKKKGIRTHTTAWMGFKTSVLSEISQTQTDKDCVIPLI